jgi:hypothetical protein
MTLVDLKHYSIKEITIPDGVALNQEHIDKAFGGAEMYDLRVARVVVNPKDWPDLNAHYAEVVFDETISGVIEIRADGTVMGNNAIWARILL